MFFMIIIIVSTFMFDTIEKLDAPENLYKPLRTPI